MAAKFTIDPTSKLFIIDVGVTTLDAKTEFYSAAKYDWLTTTELTKYRFPIASIGGQDIGGGVTISPYFSLLYGWRIAPPAADLTMTVVGNIITAEGDSPFSDSIAGPYHHDIASAVSANSLTQTIVTGGVSPTPQSIWDDPVVEAGLTPAEILRLMSAVLFGKAAGAETDTITFRDIQDLKDRVSATQDGLGNRTSVTLDET